jgi:phosphoribosyl 1,2-cyclic phosphodiesterase
MSGGIKVTFHGVRGSTPCDGPQLARYGGNTSCVSVEVEGQDPIVFDLGTGLRNFGIALLENGGCEEFQGTVLLSHLHWDHVQGLPFFVPLHTPGAELDVYGPRQAEGPLGEVFTGMMQPPYFPITPQQLEGDVRFHDVGDDDFPLSTTAKVRSRWIRHVGPTLGYRLEWQGLSIAYLSDHGQGCVGTGCKDAGLSADHDDDYVPEDVLDLCDGVDLLIHDAQHTPSEFEMKRHWGHCTIDYAVHVAKESGAQRLALFHHDPAHDDDTIDRLLVQASDAAAHIGAGEVLAASEGLTLDLAPAHAPRSARSA